MDMKFPYFGKAFEAYERIFPFSSYYTNKVYKNPFGRYVYVNTKGFLHVLVPCKIKEDGEIVGYTINDYMLTRDGTIKLVKDYGWFSTKEACIEKILSFNGS